MRVRQLRILSLVAALSVPATSAAVSDEKAATKPIPAIEVRLDEPAAFDKHVAPILQEKCIGCHDAEGGLAEGELDLTTAAAILKGGEHGPAIVPGKAAESLLYRLASRTQKPAMPPKKEPPLTPRELAIIKLWIDQGAKPGRNPQPTAPARMQPVLGALPAGVHPVYALDIDSKGHLLAAGRGNEVLVYDIASGAVRQRLGGHQDVVQSVRFSADGRWLAAGGYGTITLWSTATWGAPVELGPCEDRVTALDFSPDGKVLASGGGRPAASGELILWDIASRKPVHRFADAHSDVVYAVAFRRDGKLLASAAADKMVRVHDVATKKLVRSFEGHTHHVLGVGWKADGTLLASAGADGAVKLWNFETGEQVRNVGGHGNQVTAVVWIGTSDRLATASGDRQARTIGGAGGIERAYAGAADFLFCVDASEDGKFIAAGGQEGKVFLWESSNGRLMRTFEPTAGK